MLELRDNAFETIVFDDYLGDLLIYSLSTRDGFSYFCSGGGVDKYLGGAAACFGQGGGGWQRPERPRKKFN